MAFNGYGKGVQQFFNELDANNEKTWFEANRARFDDEIIAPTINLINEIAGSLSVLNPALQAVPKVNKSIRRIFRDTRFSKDKTPYHTHLHLIFWTGDHPNRSPGVHIVLDKDHFGFGAGHWAFDPDQLARFRADVLDDGGHEVSGVIKACEKAGLQLDPPQLARIPNGIDKTLEGVEWTRHKGLVARTSLATYPKELFGPEGADYIVGLCKMMEPLNSYLMEQVFSPS